MNLFNLPQRTIVQKVVPKNSFDTFTNSKQKKLFSDKISRITWTHKLSKDTINLETKDINEIQIFKVELKVKEKIQTLLDIIDKAIPYHIIFIVEFGESMYLHTSTKHAHATNENISVVDWNFSTNWFIPSDTNYQLNLKKSLDTVYKDLCVQIIAKPKLLQEPLAVIIQNQKTINTIQNEINSLKSRINKSKQFNKKVELNLKLKNKENELKAIV